MNIVCFAHFTEARDYVWTYANGPVCILLTGGSRIVFERGRTWKLADESDHYNGRLSIDIAGGNR